MSGFRRSFPQAFDLGRQGPTGQPVPPQTIPELLHAGPEGMIVQASVGGKTIRLGSIGRRMQIELRKDFWSCPIQ